MIYTLFITDNLYLLKPFAVDTPRVDNGGLEFSSPLDLLLFLPVHSTDHTFWHHGLDSEVVLLLLCNLQLIDLIIIAELLSRVEGQIVKADREVPLFFSVSRLMCSHCLCVSLNHQDIFEIISCFYQTGTPIGVKLFTKSTLLL